jgi:DNA-directed RNA polymerase specialized sigma24 family protein
MASKTNAGDLQDDLTLRLWGGDDSAKGEILKAWGGRTMLAVRKGYPTLSDDEVEDVICEAILRFWAGRANYDPQRAKVGTLLYKIATHVASEYLSGRLSWQKQRIKEAGQDAKFFADVQAERPADDPPDDVGLKQSPVQKALADCFAALSDLQKDILQRYADARGYEIDAATVGKDLGDKHKNGVPIPGGTIRTNKSRAWDSLDACMKKKSFDLKAMGYTNE